MARRKTAARVHGKGPRTILTLAQLGLAAGAGVVAGGACAGLYSHAALRPQSQIFGRTLVAGHDPAEVALTYDDGPNDAATHRLLEVLARFNAPAAFFMIGRYVRERAALVREVHAAGHIVGNHTQSHPWLNTQKAARVRAELRDCNAALEDVLGAPVRYFRPPHGARRPVVLREARELGLAVVQWNAMGVDWTAIPGEQIVENIAEDMAVNARRHRGSNILLHDGWDQRMGADREATIKATGMLLERFSAAGQRVVSLDRWREPVR